MSNDTGRLTPAQKAKAKLVLEQLDKVRHPVWGKFISPKEKQACLKAIEEGIEHH